MNRGEDASTPADTRGVVEATRDACVAEALEVWEQAGMSGLCTEGRWELVIDRLRHLDCDALARQLSGEETTTRNA